MINEQPPTLAERLVQLRTAITTFAHSLAQDEADRLAPLLSHVGEVYYAAAEALAQDEELTYRQANDAPQNDAPVADEPQWLAVGQVLAVEDADAEVVETIVRSGLMEKGASVTVVDADCVACGGDGWTDLHAVCPECAVYVYACMYCEQSITREDPADGWRKYAAMDRSREYICDESPDGTHVAFCGDCAGRGGTYGQVCATCEGKGYLA